MKTHCYFSTLTRSLLMLLLVGTTPALAVDIDFTGYTTGAQLSGQGAPGGTFSGGTGADTWFGNAASGTVDTGGIGSAGSETSTGPFANVNSSFEPGQGILITDMLGGGEALDLNEWWVSGLVQFNNTTTADGFGTIQLWSSDAGSGQGASAEGPGFGFNTFTGSTRLGLLVTDGMGGSSVLTVPATDPLGDYELISDKTYLFAMHYDSSNTGNELELFIDPDLNAAEPAVADLSVDIQDKIGVSALPQMNFLKIRGNLGLKADNLYVGNDTPFGTGGGQAGDYDNDGDVDGNDFLVWQRGNSPNGIGSGDLGVWQSNYGAPPITAAIASVPEPSTVLLALVSAGLALVSSRKRVVVRA